MDVESVLSALRLLLGGLFLVTGAAKLRAGHAVLMRSIGAYNVVSGRGSAAIARILGPAELVVGAALVLGLTTTAAAVGGIALLCIFNLAIGIALLRRQRNSCGCGLGHAPISKRLIVRNSVLIALLVVCATHVPAAPVILR